MAATVAYSPDCIFSQAAEGLRLGALSDFAFVKDGDGTQTQNGLILVSGLLADEFIHSTTPLRNRRSTSARPR